MTPIGNIVRRSLRQDNDRFNILSFVTHERNNSCWRDCKANFYLFQNGPPEWGLKGNWVEKYAPIPKNISILSSENPLGNVGHLNFDFILSQHKFGQIQGALDLGKKFNLDVLHYEHTVPTNDNLRAAVPKLKEIRGKKNVFISKSSCEAWEFNPEDSDTVVIEHGVDSKLFKPNHNLKKDPYVLFIVNDWVNRGDILGWDIFQRVIANNRIPTKILGDNPSISQPPQNVYELVMEYNKAAVFYNTSRHSPIPCVLLEAMACELPVVTTDNYLISEVIENGVNGYKTNSESEQLAHIKRLLADKDEREELGKNARKTILEKFDLKRFCQQWNQVFEELIK